MKDISTQIFSLLEKNQQAVILIEENNINHANKRACKLFDLSDKNLKKTKIEDIFAPDTVSEIRKNVFHQIKTGQSIIFEGGINNNQGVTLSISQTTDKMGKTILLIIEDISRKKELITTKDQILETIGHNLRNPLTNIVGYLDLLQKEKVGNLNDEQRKFISLAVKNSQFIFKIITDLLDLSKIESDSVKLEFVTFSLNDLIETTVENYKYFFEEKKIDLVFKKPATNYFMEGEKFRISQILNNLLDNALHFTEKGSVQISLVLKKDKIIIKIKDTGIGIQNKNIKNVYSKFFQAKRIEDAENSGIGLGLTICKYFVELHGGKITFDTKKNKGTTFYIELPLLKKEKL